MSLQLHDLLPLIIPLGIIELVLMIAAVIHIATHPRYRIGNRWLWLIVVIVVNTVGPILYFVLGRGEAALDDDPENDI